MPQNKRVKLELREELAPMAKAERRIKEQLFGRHLEKNEDIVNQPLYANVMAGASQEIIKEVLKEVAKEAVKEGIKAGASSSDETFIPSAPGPVTRFSCEQVVKDYPVEVTGEAKEWFWWNVEDHEITRWLPSLKEKACADAKAKLDVEIDKKVNTHCEEPCKPFKEITRDNECYDYTDPPLKYPTFWGTWLVVRCKISAKVTFGCKR